MVGMLFVLRRFPSAKELVSMRPINIPVERAWLVPMKIRPDVCTASTAGLAGELRL
jgi:hypothetical protein